MRSGELIRKVRKVNQQVIASFHRARVNGDLFETFYDRFLARSEEVRALFAKTDFVHQKRMLKISLLELLSSDLQDESVCEEIRKLGQRHVDLQVKSEHYQLWLDSLMESLALHDAQFTAELESQWRSALEPGIRIMQAVHTSSS